MKVFVAGATGVAGRQAVRRLATAGHVVTAVARTPEKAELVRSLGAEPVQVDLFDAAAVRDRVAGHEAVVNLTTKIPPPDKALRDSAWEENDRIRTEVSSNLAEAASAGGTGVFVQESLAFMYPDGGDEWLDESVPVDPPPHALSTLVAEEQAAAFTTRGGRGIVLRFGQFYAPDSEQTRFQIAMARRGLAPFLGPPEAFVCPIHAEDIGTAVLAVIDAPAGTYNIVDDDPIRQGELAQVIADALGRKRLRFTPRSIARAGGAKARFLMRSQRVSNEAFRKATGWEPRYATSREGFPAVIAAVDASR